MTGTTEELAANVYPDGILFHCISCGREMHIPGVLCAKYLEYEGPDSIPACSFCGERMVMHRPGDDFDTCRYNKMIDIAEWLRRKELRREPIIIDCDGLGMLVVNAYPGHMEWLDVIDDPTANTIT